MYAYLVVPETDSDELRPAVIWIHGGFGNGIGSTVWEEQDPKNDQSGSAFWKRGFITMYPALRGGSGNPGVQEQFLGEVDDVIAAGKYLAERPDVDPARIYLGGHSTGGTLVLLVAASTKMFRAVVAFGPVADIRSYGSYGLNFSLKDKAEWQYRSPIFWLRDIQCPTWVYEGEREPSNFDVLQEFKKVKTNQRILFFSEKGYDHFSILAPGTKKMADRIFMDSEWDPTFDTHPY
ncbi:MAG: prolyl oligopeptidase family serine peptidase [Acidobacteria bacterium]|nr:prolyl oligopeptidase family serine peptidase [Acidobacteriota bacterium]MCB9397842.1 prolyl oligopeptidase family serine peptidase [Acidobacteriota bacterium]